jgi:hypothetical protein
MKLRDKLQQICDILLSPDYKLTSDKRELRLITEIINQRYWEQLLMKDNESLCDFIIRFASRIGCRIVESGYTQTRCNKHNCAALATLLIQTSKFLSQEQKRYIRNGIALRHLIELLNISLEYLIGLLVIQLIDLDGQLIFKYLYCDVLQFATQEMGHLGWKDRYCALIQLMDVLNTWYNHTSIDESVLSDLEIYCDALQGTGLDMQSLLTRLDRLKQMNHE